MRKLLRTASFAVVLAAFFVGPTSPASAGGSNWVFDREHHQPGDIAFAWAPIAWEHDPGLGTPDDGPYHAFVVAFPAEGSSPDPMRTPVGDITISLEPYGTGALRFGPHHAELTFTVPNLPPGRYVLVHANDAGKLVGDLSGQGSFWIDPPMVQGAPSFTG